jgi:hypothetical protein
METGNYYAQPVNPSENGFYFNNFREYQTSFFKFSRQIHGIPIEEYEIQMIDQSELFGVCGIDAGTLELWFDELEDLDKEEAVKLTYLMDNGYSDVNLALGDIDDVIVFEGTVEAWAEERLNDTCLANVPDDLKIEIHFKQWDDDTLANIGGSEVTINGVDYIIEHP